MDLYQMLEKLWNKSNFVEVVVAVGQLLVFLTIIYIDAMTKPNERYMKNPIGTVSTLQQTTTFESVRNFSLSYIESHYVLANTMSISIIPMLFLMVKHLSWHPGTSVLKNTITYAFGDIMDTFIVVITLLSGIGAFGNGIFGIYGGSYDFQNFGSSFNTMARLSFGLYDYDDYVSDGLGQGYEGIGLGGANYWRYVTLWLSFILLSTIIVNILIAVISDGFEIHKDKQRLRTNSGETFIVYAFSPIGISNVFSILSMLQKKQNTLAKENALLLHRNMQKYC